MEWNFQYATAEHSFQELPIEEDIETPYEGEPGKVLPPETPPAEERL